MKQVLSLSALLTQPCCWADMVIHPYSLGWPWSKPVEVLLFPSLSWTSFYSWTERFSFLWHWLYLIIERVRRALLLMLKTFPVKLKCVWGVSCVELISVRLLQVMLQGILTLKMSLTTKWDTTVYAPTIRRTDTKKHEMFGKGMSNCLQSSISSEKIFSSTFFSLQNFSHHIFLLHGNKHTGPHLAEKARTKQPGQSHSPWKRERSRSKMADRFHNLNTRLLGTETEKKNINKKCASV